MNIIERVLIYEFTFDVNDLGLVSNAVGVANIVYEKGARLPTTRRTSSRLK